MHKYTPVRAKKHLGQHFLTDETIAYAIVKALADDCKSTAVLEVGPGMGVLTKYLLDIPTFTTYTVDIDRESIAFLNQQFPQLNDRLIEADFLQMRFDTYFSQPFSLIGNFPYNISSQIIFKMIENRDNIPLMVGMFQKEVAERLVAKTRTKAYGILTILTQAFYDVSYLFTVDEHVFNPPPKVKSAVVKLVRKQTDPDVEPKALFTVVKTAFNQRRKKLRNALQIFQVDDTHLQAAGFIDKRAEELSLSDFIALTKLIATHGKNVG